MIDRNLPQSFIPRTRLERLVAGLRDYEPPSNVKVYSAKTSKLIRIEKPPIEEVSVQQR